MYRYLTYLYLSAILLLAGCASLPLEVSNPARLLYAPTVAEDASVATCAVTPPSQDQPPDDPNADSFGYGNWHINADRTLWVSIPPSGSWHVGGEKVIWIRPAGTELRIEGKRLDADAAPLLVEIPCCYPTGFQVTGLHFPTGGCWEVNATAGEHELNFIIAVKGEQTQAQAKVRPFQRGIDATSPLARAVLLQFCNSYDCQLQLIDTRTSQRLEDFAPLELGRYASFGLSDDLTQLAVISYRDNNKLKAGRLKLVDLATWQTVTTTLTFDGAYNEPRFTWDKTRLIVFTQTETRDTNNIVYLVDVASERVLAEQRLDFYPLDYRFTPDSRAIMFFGIYNTGSNAGSNVDSATAIQSESGVALLDAASLEVIWQQPVEGLLNGQVLKEGSTDPRDGVSWQPGIVFAADEAKLYIAHADKEQLTTVDFAAQQIVTRPITKPLSWIERLLLLTARTAYAKMITGVNKQALLSFDGSQLYVIGTESYFENGPIKGGQYIQTGLGLQVIDLATGEMSAQIDTEAQSFSLDPEYGRLYLHGWTTEETRPYATEWSEVLDIHTLETLARFEHKAVAVARRLDGTPLLLSTDTLENGQTELAILDPQTFEVISSSVNWYRGYVGWVVMR